MNPIICTGKDKVVRTFVFEIEEFCDGRGDGLRYRVHSLPIDDDLEFFEAEFVLWSPEKVLQVTVLCANADRYRGVGIPEALFGDAVVRTGRTVVSSSRLAKCKRFQNDDRTNDANAMWTRLERNHQANYDAAQDRYTYI